jgi:cytochrome c oxidase subunit 2
VDASDESGVVASELRWGLVVVAVVTIIFLAILWAAVVMGRTPPSNGEVIDPKTLQLSGEFAEANLGTKVEADGSVVVRIVAAQFQFTPSCVVLPAGRLVTLRFASPDVIHGILVVGTNVNTMVVPGYISQVRTVFAQPGELLMPCHEFCGLAHGQMLARVRVVSPAAFRPGGDGRVACANG